MEFSMILLSTQQITQVLYLHSNKLLSAFDAAHYLKKHTIIMIITMTIIVTATILGNARSYIFLNLHINAKLSLNSDYLYASPLKPTLLFIKFLRHSYKRINM